MPNIPAPWAIILCKFRDKPSQPQPKAFYEDFYTRNGMGGVCDYWREVTLNTLDLTGSKVFGWYTMNRDSSEADRLAYPGERQKLVEWGIETALAKGVNLTPFGRRILVVHNYGRDHGAAGIGIIIHHQDPNLIEFGFICHEMGHGMGLPHSFSANPDTEYGGGWDIMSFATTTPLFDIRFQNTSGKASVGLNARNTEALGGLPLQRIRTFDRPDFSEVIQLDPLNQNPMGNNGFLVAKISPKASNPWRAGNSIFSIEFRLKSGWDKAISRSAVLIHEIRNNGLSFLQPSAGGFFLPNQQFMLPDSKIFIKVLSINIVHNFSTVQVWDIPEGSLRKEDSKAYVYLIENGQTRHITSPEVLMAMGRSWSQVKSVPDGALSALGSGTPITLANVQRPKASLNPGESLRPEQMLKSANGLYTLVMQGDGNLVLYDNKGKAIWATGTNGSGAVVCDMQQDGNLVLCTNSGVPVWASNTNGAPGSRLLLQDDRNLVIYHPNGRAIWASGTNI